jgi:regulator of sirC expression with transglutaminase-like and TPR domain
MTPEAARAALSALGRIGDDQFDPIAAALALAAADDPGCDVAGAAEVIAGLVSGARGLLAENQAANDGHATARGKLIGALLASHGFRGDSDTYEDAANANLARVAARRKGLPVALGLLWLAVARGLGWPAAGIDFPGHFLLALEGVAAGTATGAVVVDPFDSGRMLDAAALGALLRRVAGPDAKLTPRHLQAMRPRQVVLRLANNLRLRRLKAEAWETALSITEDMLRFAPGATWLLMDAARLAQRLGQQRRAEAHLVALLARQPGAEDATEARRLLASVRQSLN